MDKQWDYNDSLADAGGFKRLPVFYKIGYTAWNVNRISNLLRYKDSKFVVSEDGQSVEVVLPNWEVNFYTSAFFDNDLSERQKNAL